MENLQKLMPQLQELLQQWYELTLHNQEYAICLAVSVWLITAILYSIRIGFLKRDTAKIVKAKHEVQAQLDAANAQLQTLQQEVTQATEKMQAAEQTAQTESQRAADLEQRLQKSNQQLADSVANLVDCFELNQHQLPKANADNLLTEYEAIVARVAERFQNEQQAKTQLQLNYHAETAKLAEKEMLISSLQNRLDTQTQQLAKLELSIEKYESAQRQLETDKQYLAAEMQKRQAELARHESALEAEKQRMPAPEAPKVDLSTEQAITRSAPAPEQQKVEAAQATTIEPKVPEIKVSQPEPVVERTADNKAQPSKKVEKSDEGKKKGFFGRAMDKISQMDQKLGTQATVAPEPELVEAEPPREEASRPEPTPKPSLEAEDDKTPVAEKLASAAEDMSAKFSGLFGSRKNKSKADKLKVDNEAVPAAQPLAQEKKSEAKKANKLSGLFSKLKKRFDS